MEQAYGPPSRAGLRAADVAGLRAAKLAYGPLIGQAYGPPSGAGLRAADRTGLRAAGYHPWTNVASTL